MASDSLRLSWRIFVRPVPDEVRSARRLAAVTVTVLLASSAAAADELKPYTATYAGIWHGMTVAVSTLKLEHTGDTWTFSSRSEPRGIG